jgi:hypothetical protein
VADIDDEAGASIAGALRPCRRRFAADANGCGSRRRLLRIDVLLTTRRYLGASHAALEAR